MVDCSFGTIPILVHEPLLQEYTYKLVAGVPYFLLLVDARYGHWTYPKGHAQGTETPLETALRELKEETDLVPLTFKARETGCMVDRRLEFTVVHVGDQNIRLQDSEVTPYKWMSYEEVCETVTHEAVSLNTLEAIHIIEEQHC